MAVWVKTTNHRPAHGRMDRNLAGLIGVPSESSAQQLLPADREEIADQERLSWTLKKFPAQPYMNEIYWQYFQGHAGFLSRLAGAVRGPNILFDARQF